MGIYTEGQTHQLKGVEHAMNKAADPHHKAILANYLQHLALEQGGRYEEIFSRGLTVEHPLYRVGGGGEEVVYDGVDAIKGWYKTLSPCVAFLLNEKIAVDDWGFSSWSDLIEFVPGHQMAARGAIVEDESSIYLCRSNQAMFWLYDENALLIGERVYVVNRPTVEVADPDNMLTKDAMIRQCEPYFEGVRAAA